MTAEKKLEKIKHIYDLEKQIPGKPGQVSSTHIRHNLLGAYFNMKRSGKADKVCLKTIERVMWQLAAIEKVLGI